VCAVLAPTFEIPQGEAFQRGKFYTVVTRTVSILRETTELKSPAKLTLLFRHRDRELIGDVVSAPETLRVFRKSPASGGGVDLQIAPEEIEIVDVGEGKGVAFPIDLFGSYLVACERDR
jgi:hypothetical protein